MFPFLITQHDFSIAAPLTSRLELTHFRHSHLFIIAHLLWFSENQHFSPADLQFTLSKIQD